MADGEEDPAVFTSTCLPSDPRLLATVTNAYLGTRVYRDILHVNGVYNGAAGDTHRADIPSPLHVRMTVPDGGDMPVETFTLNTRTGTFSHKLQSPSYTATHQIYAHHSLIHLMAFSITIRRSAGTSQPITVHLQTPFVPKSQDLDLQQGPDFQGAHYIYGQTLVPEVEGGPQPTVHMLWTPVPQAVTLHEEEQEQCWEFLTAVAESKEEAKRSYTEGLAHVAAGSLHSSHTRAWAALWRGCCVDLEGPLPLRQAVYGCLYYLLSAIPPQDTSGFRFHGISPGGLSNGTQGEDYWGHVFWDQDTWMYPNILLFYPKAARAILEYRIGTLEGALLNAQEQGYKGAKFPWESAATGREVCPEEIYGAQEIHITGDVLMAFEQYYYTTQDQKLFRMDGGWELVSAVAQYWCSRMVWSEVEQCYHIRGVMPPDEYHHQVDNSAYTNAVAQRSLNFAASIARDFLIPVPEEWVECAKKLKVPFDAVRKYHPEYDGYSPGEPVKQADVVLLGFPLMHPMHPEVRRNDLMMYEPVTELSGPAMTWSMFAVGWLELKEMERAQGQLNKCFNNITEPFKIWVENSDGSGAVNFLTGMGGFLQVILFGYTGFRITKTSLHFDPAFPSDVNKLEVTGVSYLGSKLKFSITKEEMRIGVTKCPLHPALEVVLEESGRRFPLHEGQSISFPTAAGCIQRAPTEGL
ncbi:protein-glucosylgalactosylhydroxylysine glucosidase isoform X2 [Excalfactoria chinensis]